MLIVLSLYMTIRWGYWEIEGLCSIFGFALSCKGVVGDLMGSFTGGVKIVFLFILVGLAAFILLFLNIEVTPTLISISYPNLQLTPSIPQSPCPTPQFCPSTQPPSPATSQPP